MPETFDHRNCPYANRCSKYTELTLRNDRKDERIRRVLAENARLKARVAELEALVSGDASDASEEDASEADVRPFWELVYHGIILYTSDRLCQNHTRGKCLYKLEKSGDPRWMEGDGVEDPYAALKIVEFGGRPIFYTYKFADVPRIRKAWDEFVPVRHLQRELMVSHRQLAPDVFETAYANGERTVCNYGSAAYCIADGVTVSRMGYVLIPSASRVRGRSGVSF